MFSSAAFGDAAISGERGDDEGELERLGILASRRAAHSSPSARQLKLTPRSIRRQFGRPLCHANLQLSGCESKPVQELWDNENAPRKRPKERRGQNRSFQEPPGR